MTLAHMTRTRNLPTKFGNPSKTNIVECYDNGAELFTSYGHPIAATRGGETRLTGYWDASATTNEYRIRFTGKNMKDTRKAIESGEMQIVSVSELNQWAREV